MSGTAAAPKKNPLVRWKPTGKTGILLNLTTGEYFELDHTALAIWKMIDGRRSVAEIATRLAATRKASQKVVARDVAAFVSSLQRRNLIGFPRPRR